VLSAQGWLKRAREIKDLASTRLREGDSVQAVTAGSTRASVAFFSSQGSCYVCRLNDVPSSTGYGDPVQKLFKLDDGERMVAMFGLDPRVCEVPEASGEEPEPPFAVAITQGGLGFRFSLTGHRDPSTRAGRKFARLNDGDEVVFVGLVEHDDDSLVCVSSGGDALSVRIAQLAMLGGAGKGTTVMKLEGDAKIVGATIARRGRGTITVVTEKGRELTFDSRKLEGDRADRGEPITKRTERPVRLVGAPLEIPRLSEEESV
jgi:DNA gyrase subunit A